MIYEPTLKESFYAITFFMYTLLTITATQPPSITLIHSPTSEINTGLLDLAGCSTMCSITAATECNASPPLGALNFITIPER